MNLARIKLHNYKAAHKIDIPVAYLSMRLNTTYSQSFRSVLQSMSYAVWRNQLNQCSRILLGKPIINCLTFWHRNFIF